jgi:hypothetical protein
VILVNYSKQFVVLFGILLQLDKQELENAALASRNGHTVQKDTCTRDPVRLERWKDFLHIITVFLG